MIVGRSQWENLTNSFLELLDRRPGVYFGEEKRAIHANGRRYHLKVESEVVDSLGPVHRARARRLGRHVEESKVGWLGRRANRQTTKELYQLRRFWRTEAHVRRDRMPRWKEARGTGGLERQVIKTRENSSSKCEQKKWLSDSAWRSSSSRRGAATLKLS